MKSTILVFTALTLSGCAASGKLYNDISRDSLIIEPTKGRLTVFRTTETLVASGRDALVTLDKASAKYVSYGGFVSIDITAGDHELNVGMSSDKTRCEIPVLLKPSEELFFEVKPLADRIYGEAATAGVAATFSLKGIYGVGGNVKIAPMNCNGYFSIALVDREYAQKQLTKIHESAQ